MCGLARQLGHKVTTTKIVAVLADFLKVGDEELSIKSLKQIPGIASFLSTEKEKYYITIILLFRLLIARAKDDNVIIQSIALNVIVAIIDLLKSEDIEKFIVPLIECLLERKYSYRHRNQGIDLISHVAMKLKKETLLRLLSKYLLKMFRDVSPKVRNTLIINLGNIVKVLEPSEIEVLISMFYTDYKYEHESLIRCHCLHSIPEISLLVSHTYRLNVLLPLFQDIISSNPDGLDDFLPNIIGYFIYTFKGHPIPAQLIQSYKEIVIRFTSHDDKIAFTFPAVVETLGQENWPEISDVLFILQHSRKVSTRKILASSIHVLSSAIGHSFTRGYLSNALQYLLNDRDENVRLAVLKKSATICKHLSPVLRNNIFKSFKNAIREKNWRFRHSVAKQMHQILHFYGDIDQFKTDMFIMFIELIDDPIGIVRETMMDNIDLILNNIADIDYRTEFIEYFKSLASSRSSVREKQLYIRGCQSLYDRVSEEDFYREFYYPLLKLKSDQVYFSEIAQNILL